jgi:proline iminopeptidase
MDRRKFLKTSAALSIAASTSPFESAASADADIPRLATGDQLNPKGIRVAGIRMVPVVGGKYKVWTKRVGTGDVKVLLLHGGPGGVHDYLEAMESFLPQANIEMYYYDQLGSGNSDVPDDPSLWNIERFLTEVEEVRQGLDLNHFVLYGHSWGGMLAIEYALQYQQHLRGLVISDMAASSASYLRRVNQLKVQMLSPEEIKKVNALEAAKDYDNPEYERLMFEVLYPQAICRIKPWPEPVTRNFRLFNTKIYNQMQGKSEFDISGNLKDWDRWADLPKIKVKALTIGAKYDEMDPEDMKKMATLMPNASSVICENGSHFCFWDDQEFYFQHLVRFLKSV